jgi:hypothetical protein
MTSPTAEELRLSASRERKEHWKRWGPYLSERAWGTVREDYSATGQAWEYFPHDHARSRAYRWNEDGIAGICDRHQNLCFAISLWNGNDSILKERMFGLSGNEGNHGEDVKEYYFYLDNTPTHSYMKYQYKYPQAAFPYAELVEETSRRSRQDPEYELLDTGIFHENRYFDVVVEYAKAGIEDILVRITCTNRGPDAAELHLLPTLWFRNTWSWRSDSGPRPLLRQTGDGRVEALSEALGKYSLFCAESPALLFTENDTNVFRLYGEASSQFFKDGIHNYVVHGELGAVNREDVGTKVAAHYRLMLGPSESSTTCLRLTNNTQEHEPFNASFDRIFQLRKQEADDFYATIIPASLTEDAKNVMRQALGGLLWSKQFYHYTLRHWLKGDSLQPPPPPERIAGRNARWGDLSCADVMAMPDKWEYPWFAAWDLSFHCVALALVDTEYSKEQLSLMLREWYMHPSGQLPAYEWAFGDVNPPVHAWAAWRVYRMEEHRRGLKDIAFLESVFHKLLLNFTWWVNRKDAEGMNVFEGGFLGLDNIGIFDRSAPLPTGGHMEQSDGTSWMGAYSLNMFAIASELAMHNPVYENVASKFWEHFLHIANAMNHLGSQGTGLWDEEDGFFYDVLHTNDGDRKRIKVRSMVGLVPLFAVQTIEPDALNKMPAFKRRLEWFVEHRTDLIANVACMMTPGIGERRLMSIVDERQLRAILRIMLDEREFLSPYGIRALSQIHRDHPFTMEVGSQLHQVAYEPGVSGTNLFGGNSNWRGPIWFPMNFLIVESLQKFDCYYGPDFKVECPTGSGVLLTLGEIATELSQRLSSIFLLQEDGTRPVQGCMPQVADDPLWKDLLLFFEYFNGDNGAGVGASHQTGWTALVAKLLQQSGNRQARVPEHQKVEKPVAAAATEEKAREMRQQGDSDR